MDLDITFFIQLGIFVLLLVSLTKFIIRPLQDVIELRHDQIHGRQAQADRLLRKSVEDREAYEARLHQARVAAARERELLRAEGRTAEARIVNETRAKVSLELSQTRGQVAQEESQASEHLTHEVTELAEQMAHKLLGRPLSQQYRTNCAVVERAS